MCKREDKFVNDSLEIWLNIKIRSHITTLSFPNSTLNSYIPYPSTFATLGLSFEEKFTRFKSGVFFEGCGEM
jgi:hypothetical protein